MLVGNLGQQVLLRGDRQVAVEGRSVDLHLLDKQRRPVEYPVACTMTFFSPNAGQNFLPWVPALVEWGSGGMQCQLPITRAYRGLCLPLFGSWFRATLISPVGITPTVTANFGAMLSEGTPSRPAILREVNGATLAAMANINLDLAPGASQPGPGFVMMPFIGEYMVTRGSVAVPFATECPGGGSGARVEVPAGANMDWMPFTGDATDIDLFNLDPANAADFAVSLRLTL